MHNPNIVPFIFGPFSVTLFEPGSAIGTFDDLPNGVATLFMPEDDNYHKFQLLKVSVIGENWTEEDSRKAFTDKNFGSGLRRWLSEVTRKHVDTLQGAVGDNFAYLLQRDLKLGEIKSVSMKYFARMNVGTMYMLDMFREKHMTPVMGSTGIHGRWTLGDESGIFNLNSKFASGMTALSVKDPERMVDCLEREFNTRFPFMSKPTFMLMDEFKLAEYFATTSGYAARQEARINRPRREIRINLDPKDPDPLGSASYLIMLASKTKTAIVEDGKTAKRHPTGIEDININQSMEMSVTSNKLNLDKED